jgi:hypothetical protein
MVLAPSLFAGILVSGQADGQVMVPLPPNVGWQNGTIDNGGVGTWPSIAIDNDGHVHASYADYTSGGLKYAYDESGVWVTRYIDSSMVVGTYTSIAVDNHGRSYISYADTGNFHLKFATNADGTWRNTTVDQSGAVGEFTSIALGPDGSVHISYQDIGNHTLKYAHLINATWHIETVDSPGAEVGEYTSIAVDSSGMPHITYFDITNHCLKYAYKTASGWITASIAVTAGAAGPNEMALNSTGVPFVAYAASATGIVSVAHLDGTTWDSEPLTGSPRAGVVDSPKVSIAVDENDRLYVTFMNLTTQALVRAMYATGSWTYSTVDPTPGAGLFSAMKVDQNGKVQVVYLENGRLMYATDSGASWYAVAVDDTGSNMGNLNCIATDPLGNIHIAYRDGSTGNLMYAKESPTGAWSYAVIDGTGQVDGTHNIAMAVDASGKAYVLYHVADGMRFATDSAGSWMNGTIYGNTATSWTILLDSVNHCHLFFTTGADTSIMATTRSAGHSTPWRPALRRGFRARFSALTASSMSSARQSAA